MRSSRSPLLRALAIFGGTFVLGCGLAACSSDTTANSSSNDDGGNAEPSMTGEDASALARRDEDATDSGSTMHDSGAHDSGVHDSGVHDSSTSPAKCESGANGVIAANHGHLLVVGKADIAAATDKTYSIQGTADHSHDVTLTAAHFAELASGKTITVTSTKDSDHTHTVTMACS